MCTCQLNLILLQYFLGGPSAAQTQPLARGCDMPSAQYFFYKPTLGSFRVHVENLQPKYAEFFLIDPSFLL